MGTDPLYALMTWLSPAFPVGAFTYSHGLEWAVEEGTIRDGASMAQWVEGVLTFGAGRVDADLFRMTHEAVTAVDLDAFDQAVETADALRGTAELAMERVNQGRAFLRTVSAAWPHPALSAWTGRLAALDRPPAYAVSVALLCALHGVPARAGLTAYLHALSANLVSAAVRLVPLGQTDGQVAQARLAPVVSRCAGAALDRPPEDLGSAAVAVDLASMFHETQYTRLFRS